MKKIVLLVAGIWLFLPLTVQAADLEYQSFESKITVNKDASIDVQETINVRFLVDKHGIFRKIPFRYATENGKVYIPIENINVTMDNQPEKSVETSISHTTTEVIIRIGDPNKTITGNHQYTISYHVPAAVNFFSGHDELYWNITGENWDQPLNQVKATIQLPAEIDESLIETTCYTGPTGSTASECEKRVEDGAVLFTSSTFLTAVVGWQTGVIVKPANFDQIRSKNPYTAAFQKSLQGWRFILNLALPLLALGLMIRRWQISGRDPGTTRTIIAQYDPPDDLRPAELSSVMTEKISPLGLSATLVDLAVRGYIKIIETEKKRLLGLGQTKEFALRSTKAPDDHLRAYERDLLEVLFEKQIFPAAENEIRLSDLKKRRYTTNPFAPLFREVLDWVSKNKYFVSNPNSVRLKIGVIGVVIAVVGVISIISQSFPLWGLIPAGIIVAAFSASMPKRTVKGVQAAWVGHGFKLFLRTAERYRAEWQARQGIYEKFLPYAMIFGVAEEWSKALESAIKVNPDWYEGPSGAHFNSLIFWSSFSSFSNSVSAAVVHTAASGSSGFSGGFSGGGGGGGGGGGW